MLEKSGPLAFCMLAVAILLSTNNAFAVADNTKRIRPLGVLTGIPRTSLRTLETSFSKKAIVPWSVITATTIASYAYDREMLDEVQRWGRSTGIGNSDNTKTIFSLGPYPIFRFPSDTGSALYFLGDGWTHFSIAGSFLLAGQLGQGNRPHNTGYEIIHGMIVSTIFSQAIKRATGRESPSEATDTARGRWRPFPSVNAYGKNTAKYDAFPSGHVMTSTLMFTVINENYPEYSHITVPLGAVWVTLLGLQMMNNGVHWVSDYPLGLAMGYLIGRLSVGLGEEDKPEEEKSSLRPVVFPGIASGDTQTLNFLWTY